MHGQVTIPMSASATTIWALVSDITRIGEFSPETFEAEWLGSADGPGVGNRFRGHVKRNQKGPTYWTECVVSDSEPGRVFGFDVIVQNKPINHWEYRLDPRGDTTDVTESFRLANTTPNRLYWTLLGRWRSRTNLDGMRSTLERIRAIAESS